MLLWPILMALQGAALAADDDVVMATPLIAVGQRAPQFTLSALNENVALAMIDKPQVSLSDVTTSNAVRPSKGVVVYFFESRDAAVELQKLNDLNKKLDRKGVRLLAVCADDARISESSEWALSLALDYPLLYDNHGVVVERYGFPALPVTLLVDGVGRVFAVGSPTAKSLKRELMVSVRHMLSDQR